VSSEQSAVFVLCPAGRQSTVSAGCMASSETPQRPGEFQRCVGVGWVKFDRGGEGQAPSSDIVDRVPALRCAGVRVSQPLTTSRRSRDLLSAESGGSAASLSSRSSAGSLSTDSLPASAFHDVADETWALVCAGQLSMIVPPGAPYLSAAHSNASSPAAASRGAQTGSWAPCRVRCAGLSLRLDTVVAEGEGAAEAAPGPSAPRPVRPVTHGEGGDTLQSLAEEYGRVGLQGVKDVAGRASSILWSVRGAAGETGWRRFATGTTDAAQRICWQAAKIVKRSGEQVGRLASAPWRGPSDRNEPQAPSL